MYKYCAVQRDSKKIKFFYKTTVNFTSLELGFDDFIIKSLARRIPTGGIQRNDSKTSLNN